VQFELVCPSSDEAVRRDDPANAGYSHRAIVERLDKLLERGHTYDLVYTDKLPPEERTKRYHAAAAEFAIRARRTKRKGERISRVFGSAKEGGGRYYGVEVPALTARENGSFIGLFPHDLPSGEVRTIRAFLDSLLA
jgi:hypothetical protein